MTNKIALVIATFFGTGLSPKAPGTAGSFATLFLACPLVYFFGLEGIVYSSVVIFFIGVAAVHKIIHKSTDKDPGKIVIDETVGQLVSFSLVTQHLYHTFSLKALLIYLLGFGLFRLFDICKIGPVKWADSKLHNAWGVMLDDVFAGLFAAIVLMLITTKL